MERSPRKKGERILNMDTLFFLISIGVSATIAIMALYSYSQSLWGPAVSQTMLFTTFVIMEMFIVYVVRWRYMTGAFSNLWLHLSVAASVILQLALIYGPFGPLFGTVPLSPENWEVIAVSLAGFFILLIAALKIEPFLVTEDDPSTRRL
jgi:Ca2+-transporting ATPase